MSNGMHARRASRRLAVVAWPVAAMAALALAAILWQPPAAPAARTPADADLVRIHLLFTNDVHGHIAPEGARFMNPNFPPPLGGAASAAAYIEKVREEAARDGDGVLLVDVGDMFQGTPVGNKTQGTAVIDYYNHIGYDLVVPGNHDFDLGRENTERLARMSKFPWLCANLVWKDSGQIPDWLQPTLLLERAGLRLGFIGIITPTTAKMSFPSHIEGLKFLPMPETIERYRKQLLEQGAQVIFLAIHEGLPYDREQGWQQIVDSENDETRRSGPVGGYDRYGGINLMQLLEIVPGIDIAIGGHTHRGYEEPWVDPRHHTIAFETFGNGSSLGHAVLKFDRRTGTLLGWEAPHDRGTIVTLFEDELWPDSATAAVLAPDIEKTEAAMDRVIGHASVNLTRGGAGGSLMGNVVTDAMRERFDADFAIQNLGGLRADIPGGPITSRDVFGVLPFGNDLVVARISGSMLLKIVEAKLYGDGSGLLISGGEVAYDLGRPEGQRVVSFTVGGRPLEFEREYAMVVTNYLMQGNSGLDVLTTVPSNKIEATQVTTAEAFEVYLQKHDPLDPHIDDRWVERPGQQRADYLDAP